MAPNVPRHEAGASKRILAVAGGSLLGATAFYFPAFSDPEATGFGDWQYFHHMWEAASVAISRHGEWPLWDPYHCGGITLWENPQAQVYSPLFLLSFLLGTTMALKVLVVFHAALGFAGAWWFARRFEGLGAVPSALAAAAWATSGFFAWHVGGGHAAFLPFYLTPWVLVAWRRSLLDLRWTAATASLSTFVLLEGGVYPFVFFMLLILADLGGALGRYPLRNLLGALGLTMILTVLLGAVRLVPSLSWLSRSPRMTPSNDALRPSDLLTMLTAREHPWVFRGHEFFWPEYGSYIGLGVLVLALAGVIVAWTGRRKHLLVGALVFGTLMLGHGAWWYPWALLHELPVLDSLRVPSRFAVFFIFYLALLAATTLDAIERASAPRMTGRSLRFLVLLVVVAVAVDLFLVNGRNANQWKGRPIDHSPPAPRFHLVFDEDYLTRYASYPHLNTGSDACDDPMKPAVSKALWFSDQPQARIVRSPGTVLGWGRTPNRIWAEVALEQPARVVFNQNYDPGWVSPDGPVLAEQGLLALDVPTGRHHLEIRYRPASLPWALGLSLVGLSAAGLMVLGRPGRKGPCG